LSSTDYFISHLFNVNLLFKTQVVTKSFTYSRGKSSLVECHPVDDEIVRGSITANGPCMRRGGVGGLINAA